MNEVKISNTGQETFNQGEIKNQEKELDHNYKDLNDLLNMERLQLINSNELKMKNLQEELDLRSKV